MKRRCVICACISQNVHIVYEWIKYNVNFSFTLIIFYIIDIVSLLYNGKSTEYNINKLRIYKIIRDITKLKKIIHCYKFTSLINIVPLIMLEYCIYNNFEKQNFVKHLCKVKSVL